MQVTLGEKNEAILSTSSRNVFARLFMVNVRYKTQCVLSCVGVIWIAINATETEIVYVASVCQEIVSHSHVAGFSNMESFYSESHPNNNLLTRFLPRLRRHAARYERIL